MMVRVNIDSVRVSLMSQHRIVVLKDAEATRYLPIWIGPFEADAITIELQDVEVARPSRTIYSRLPSNSSAPRWSGWRSPSCATTPFTPRSPSA